MQLQTIYNVKQLCHFVSLCGILNTETTCNESCKLGLQFGVLGIPTLNFPTGVTSSEL